jgi:hypothetical protein
VCEIHGPMLTGTRWDGQQWQALLPDALVRPSTDTQTFRTVEPVDAFVIECAKFAP